MSTDSARAAHQPTTAGTGSLAGVVEAFARQWGARLADPEFARERCQEFSDAFAERCRAAGIEAVSVSGAQFGEVAEFPGTRLLLQGHFGTRVLSDPATGAVVVYDWTARQFDHTAPVPTVRSLGEWEKVWAPLGGRFGLP
jgi:transglutaminase-like putative cysteine protease